MKKIIAIYSSPSRGRNSDSMMDSFVNGIKEKGDIEVIKVDLNSIEFDPCSFENRNGPQPHETDFRVLTEHIQSADGVVISTPTYNFSVPAQLKNLIDRIRFFALDFENKNKLGQPMGRLNKTGFYFLVSGGTPTWAQKILFFAFPPFWLRGVFLYYGAKCLGAIYSGDVKTYENKKILQKCEKAGYKYANKILNRKHNGILERVFWRPPQID